MVAAPEHWPWSSAAAHCIPETAGQENPGTMLDMQPWRERWTMAEWRGYLSAAESADDLSALRHCTHTGRPLGTTEFVAQLEQTSCVRWPRKRVAARKSHRRTPGKTQSP